jgi:small subunit ribosomal protein S20
MLKKSIILRSSPLAKRERERARGKKGGSILATHLSAIKRARQNEKRRLRNLQIKTTVKSSVKKVKTAIEKKDVEGAQKALSKAIPLIQKAHSKGVFHKNTSARKISRLTHEIKALTGGSK